MVSYKDALYYSPQHKMGIRVLHENQLREIFPEIEKLEVKIEEHRSFIRERQDIISQEAQSNLMFDNIFAILGERGSGKTSTVYTLKKLWQEKQRGDIFLPIIMTEMIPEKFQVMAWLLSLLEGCVEDIDKQMGRGESGCGRSLFEDCAKNEKSLHDLYAELKSLYFSSVFNVDGTAESFSEGSVHTEKKVQNSFDFTQKLSEFWTRLVQAQKLANQQSGRVSVEYEPLIYMIFDDVDLAPERIPELLSTIMKYLSHPNVLVFVTAEEGMLYEIVQKILCEKIYGKDTYHQLMIGDRSQNGIQLQVKQKAELYLGKMLPPSARYYIQNFDLCERKAEFTVQLEFDEQKTVKSEIHPEEFLSKLVSDYCGKTGASKDNFLYDKAGTFIRAYLIFLGNTARQINNGCMIVRDFIKRMQSLSVDHNEAGEEILYLKRVFQSVEAFWQSILHVSYSTEYNESELKALTEKLFHLNLQQRSIEIDYRILKARFDEIFDQVDLDMTGQYLEDVSRENISDDRHQEKILNRANSNIQLYVLLFFVENILAIEIEKTKKRSKAAFAFSVKFSRGLVYLKQMLDKITPSPSVLVFMEQGKRHNQFLSVYGGLLEQPELISKFDMNSQERTRKYLETISHDLKFEKTEDLSVIYEENPAWFQSMVKLLYLANEEMYQIETADIQMIFAGSQRNIQDIGMR